MRSFIIIEVEHGETTDPLDQFIANAMSEADYEGDISVEGYAVSVDLPPFVSTVNVNALLPMLSGLSWDERAKVESGKSLDYRATHVSGHDGSPAMLVSSSEDGLMLTLVNEDGYEWTDRAKDWRPIE